MRYFHYDIITHAVFASLRRLYILFRKLSYQATRRPLRAKEAPMVCC